MMTILDPRDSTKLWIDTGEGKSGLWTAEYASIGVELTILCTHWFI